MRRSGISCFCSSAVCFREKRRADMVGKRPPRRAVRGHLRTSAHAFTRTFERRLGPDNGPSCADHVHRGVGQSGRSHLSLEPEWSADLAANRVSGLRNPEYGSCDSGDHTSSTQLASSNFAWASGFVVPRSWAASVKCGAHDHARQNSTPSWQNLLPGFACRKGVRPVTYSSAWRLGRAKKGSLCHVIIASHSCIDS
jgi:hypothetical protein